MIPLNTAPLRVALVPLIRPLFRGARLGLDRSALSELSPLQGKLGIALEAFSPVTDAAEAQAARERLLASPPDLLLVLYVTFATSDLLLPLLSSGLPAALWALPEAWEEGPLPQNALCGLNLGLSLDHPGPVKWIYGAASDPRVHRALQVTAGALRARQLLTRGKLLWLGGPAPGFDAFSALPDFGLQVERVDHAPLWEALSQVDRDQVEQLLAEAEPVQDQQAERSLIALELALLRLSHGYDGVALREWPEIPDRLGLMPYRSVSRLAEAGLICATEGDLLGLASMLALQRVGGTPPLLLDLVHLSEKGLMVWHAGEAAPSWREPGSALRVLPHFNRGLPAMHDLTLRSGPVSGLRLLPRAAAVYGGRLSGQRGFDGDAGWLAETSWSGESLSPEQFLTSWLNRRLPHHLPLIAGEHQETLLELCDWLSLPVLPASCGRTLIR